MIKNKKMGKICTAFLAFLCLALFLFAPSTNTLFFYDLCDVETTAAIAELNSDCEVYQTIPILYEKTTAIGVQLSTYEWSAMGEVTFRAYQDDLLLGEAIIDAATVQSCEYVYVPLKEAPLQGSCVDLQITSNCRQGKALAVCGSTISLMAKNGGFLRVNGTELPYQLHVALKYSDAKLPGYVIPVITLLTLLFFLTGIPQELFAGWSRKKRKEFILSVGLLLLGVAVFSFRNLMFAQYPVLYAEDGGFLARQMKDGILHSLFTTRSGGANDFSNTMTYVLEWVALVITKRLHGFNLQMFPLWVGLLTNTLYSGIAVLAYRVFKKLFGSIEGLLAYATVILVPLGNSATEVIGRPANTQFLWLPICAILLLLLYLNNDELSLRSVGIQVLCFLGASTFPVCYMQIGLYLGIITIREFLGEKRVLRLWAKNIIMILALFRGFTVLPDLLGSQGGTEQYHYTASQAVEFFIARHFLYPFINPIYCFMKNSVVILLFGAYVFLVIYAAAISTKRQKTVFTVYNFFAIQAVCSILVSAIMRRAMTYILYNYTHTYPERYFYGCNILSSFLLLYAVIIIYRDRAGKHADIRQRVGCALVAIYLIPLLMNPVLFQFSDDINGLYTYVLNGKYYGTIADSCCDAMEKGELIYQDSLPIAIYPYNWNGGGIPCIDLPYEYVLTTALKSKWTGTFQNINESNYWSLIGSYRSESQTT